MKTNILKTGIALIIVIACSFSLISKDKSSDDWQSSDDYQVAKITTDSGWVQKDGYLENALQVGSISFFRYSNDGQYLFTFGSDYTFRKWDVRTGKVVKEIDFNYLKSMNRVICSFDMHQNEDLLAINTYSDMVFVDTCFISYIFNKDTLYKRNDSISNLIKIWDNCILHDLKSAFLNDEILYGHTSICDMLYGQYYETGGCSWWDLDSCYHLRDDIGNMPPDILLTSKNQKNALISFKSNKMVTKLALRNFDKDSVFIIQHYNDSHFFHNLAFSNNSKYLTATRGSLYTLCWDVDEEKIIYLIRQPNLKNTQFSADDKFLITTLEKPDTSIIKFFLAETGVEADSIYFASKSHNGLITVAPDSISIAVAGNDGRIRIFQPKIFTKTYKTYFAADSIFKQLGNPIQFSDYSLPNATSWHWDFGDGTKSYEQNPVHNYKTKGLYTVELITSNGIQIDTMIKKDYIRMLIPVVADYDTYISQDTVPFQVKFNNKSQGDIISYTWIINDKVVSKEENPIINFTYWGDYDVIFIVYDGYFSDTLNIKERIKLLPPTIPFFSNLMEKRYFAKDSVVYGIKGIETEDKSFVFIGEYYERIYHEEYNEIELVYAYSMLFKIDSIGNIIWQNKSIRAKLIKQTSDSCILVVGDNFRLSDNFLSLRKYSIEGNLINEKIFPAQFNEFVKDVFITPNNDILIIGSKIYYNNSFLTKIDKDWNHIYLKNYDGYAVSLLNINDNNFYLVNENYNTHQIVLNKIDESGNIIWQKLIGDFVYPVCAKLLNNNDILISGYKGNADNNIKYNPYLIKVDSSGNKLWEYVGVDTLSNFNGFVNLSDSLFILAGNFNSKIGLQIINNQGELVNKIQFPDRVGEIKSIVTTKDNDLFLTGSITPPYKLSQLYTLLLKHPYIITSVEEEQTENIANPELPFSIFPNPTNSTATLQYKIETPTNLKIEIIDFMGTKVSELENTYKEVGKYNTLINFENLAIAKGVYFVRFIANGNVFVSKVIYL